jgi:hypothetical protein
MITDVFYRQPIAGIGLPACGLQPEMNGTFRRRRVEANEDHANHGNVVE